jgi:hypothetical protein
MHLDQDLKIGPRGVENAGRLLVHPPGSWRQRPDAVVEVPNLFLAADYVKTSVDLASMEGANEAGRPGGAGRPSPLVRLPAPWQGLLPGRNDGCSKPWS